MLTFLAPEGVLRQVAERAKARRIAAALTQKDLSERSGVKIDSLRRFERTGRVSFESLVKIALVLGALDDFTKLFPEPEFRSISEVLGNQRRRQRVRKSAAA